MKAKAVNNPAFSEKIMKNPNKRCNQTKKASIQKYRTINKKIINQKQKIINLNQLRSIYKHLILGPNTEI